MPDAPTVADHQPLSERVAAEIRAILARFELRQSDLAAVLGVTQAQASRKLHCINAFSIDELELISDWLETTPAYLMGVHIRAPSENAERGSDVYTAKESTLNPSGARTCDPRRNCSAATPTRSSCSTL